MKFALYHSLRFALTAVIGLLSVCSAAHAQRLAVSETAATITIKSGEQTVLVYNKTSPPVPAGINAIYQRSGFVHPVFTPAGDCVTAAFPVDHAHQHGIFSAWVKTTYAGKEVDFWNLAGRTGRVAHESVVRVIDADDEVGFEVTLLHQTVDPAVDVLRENWLLTVKRTEADCFCFEITSLQTALTDEPLVVEKYHYGGMALRGPVSWLNAKDSHVKQHAELKVSGNTMLNNLGQGAEEGNHAHSQWVAMTGSAEGRPATIAVLCHRDNFRAPQAARLHPTKPYFCFSPCVDGEFLIDRAHPRTAKYRYLVTAAPADQKWLDEQWNAWR